jgi:hypothetical protein
MLILGIRYRGDAALESLQLSIRLERRWPLWCALAIAIAWAATAAAAVLFEPLPPLSAHAIAALAAALLPPAALTLLVVALLPAAGHSLALAELEPRLAEARAITESLAREAQHLDASLASSSARIAALAASAHLPQLSERAIAFEQSAARVVAGGESTQRIVTAFAEALPALERTIAAVDTTLRAVSTDSANQFRAIEAMMAAVQTHNHDAVATAATTLGDLNALLARIDEASVRNTSALSKRAYALDAAIDGVLERSTAAVDGIHKRVVEQLTAMNGGLEGAGRHLSLLGDDGARLFGQRLEMLRQTSDDLQARTAAHAADSDRLQASMSAWLDAIESRFESTGAAGTAIVATLADTVAAQADALEQRLAAVRATSGSTADAMATRIAAIESALAALAIPLDSADTALAALEARTGHFGEAFSQTEALLAARLADTRESMATLGKEAQQLMDSVTALGASASDGAGLVEDAAAELTKQRDAVMQLSSELAGHFEAASIRVAAIETAAAIAAEGITSGLGAEVARIANATESAAAAMRASLAQVVNEAVATLETSAPSRAELAFGAPLRAHITAIESASERAAAAGQHSASRLAALSLSLVETIGMVEARIDAVDTRFELRARDSMAAQAMRIIRQLQASAVDLAELLGLSISEADWQRHLRGDGSIIAQSLAGQLNPDVARQMVRLFQHDPAYRSEASRFCTQFEAMIRQLLGNQDGEALAATLLSSDIGKIYAAMANASGRNLAQR